MLENAFIKPKKPHWSHKYQCEICASTFVHPELKFDPDMDHIGERCPNCHTFDLFRKFNYEKYKAKKMKLKQKLKKKVKQKRCAK